MFEIEDQPKSEGPEKRLREHLRTKNLRMTPERLLVLEGVLSRDGHFDAEELLRYLEKEDKRVSRATLYRTLEHLTDAGLVKKHHFHEGHAMFERSYKRSHHDHMVCDRCETVIEFVSDDIEALQDQLCRRKGFHPTHHVHQIFGLCADCQLPKST